MNKIDLSITTTNVEIKVVKVGRSKMTLSVFSQIVEEPLFDADFNLKGEILGCVNKKGFFVLWVLNGMLRKTELVDLKIPKRHESTSSYSKEYIFGYEVNRLYKHLRYLSQKKYEGIKEKGAWDQVREFEDLVNLPEIEKYLNLRQELLTENNQLFIAI